MSDYHEIIERQRHAIAALQARVTRAESRASHLDMAGRVVMAELRAARRVVECAQAWRQALDAPDGVVDAEMALRAALAAYEEVTRGG